MIDFPPEKDWIDKVDADAAQAAWDSIGAGHVGNRSGAAPHPLMHRTETVDFALCLEGEIHLVLDDSEVLIGAGDTHPAGDEPRLEQPLQRRVQDDVRLVDGTFEDQSE